MPKKDSSKTDFEMPGWMDCAWKRIPCGKDECKICGRIKRDRQRHVEAGEDPDDMKCVMEDVGRSFRETFILLEKDAKRLKIDLNKISDTEFEEPPEIEKFPLCLELMAWHREILKIGMKPRHSRSAWIQSEAAWDLFWYANLLPIKTYRQFCSRWEMDRGDDVEFDYKYTNRVLKESLKILKLSLNNLIIYDVELLASYVKLNSMEKDILEV